MQKQKSRISRLLLTNGKHITAETVNIFLKAVNRYTFGYVGHTAFVWFGLLLITLELLLLGSLAQDYWPVPTARVLHRFVQPLKKKKKWNLIYKYLHA